jgi:hypothetical protein
MSMPSDKVVRVANEPQPDRRRPRRHCPHFAGVEDTQYRGTDLRFPRVVAARSTQILESTRSSRVSLSHVCAWLTL